MVFEEEYEASRFKELQVWLAENVIDIPEPQEVTLSDFEIYWPKWSGKFKVRFDEFECQDTFGLEMEMTGFPKFYFPMFTYLITSDFNPTSFAAFSFIRT